jgi:hypothetical protein
MGHSDKPDDRLVATSSPAAFQLASSAILDECPRYGVGVSEREAVAFDDLQERWTVVPVLGPTVEKRAHVGRALERRREVLRDLDIAPDDPLRKEDSKGECFPSRRLRNNRRRSG